MRNQRWSLAAAMGLIVICVFALAVLWTPMQSSTHTVSTEQPRPPTTAR